MEALKIKGVAHEGILSVRVPKEFEDKELEVIVLFSNEKITEFKEGEKILTKQEKVKKFHQLPVEERLKALQQYVSTAKYPDFPISKYDVYEQ